MKELTGFSKTNFTCDTCGKEFQQEVAYSVAKN
jgi:transposase-like protein